MMQSLLDKSSTICYHPIAYEQRRTKGLNGMELVLEPQIILDCVHCGRQCTQEDAQNNLCPSCQALAGTRECESCHEEFIPPFVEEDSDAVDDYPLCEKCTLTCDCCEDKCTQLYDVKNWNSYRNKYDDVQVCDACHDTRYTQCDDCSNYVQNRSATRIAGNDICNTCTDSYSLCDDCGEYYNPDNMHGTYCETCWQENHSSRSVQSYSYHPAPVFFDAQGNQDRYPTGLYHGIELECGWRAGGTSEYAQQVTDALGDICYLKEDSTITCDTGFDGGFEIVTHPCKIEWLKAALRAICDGKIPGLLSHNTDNAGCGLHISVNRSALTNHAIARICAFIGADQNERWLVRMARRKSNEWAEIVKKTCVEDTIDPNGNLVVNYRRYEAVNLQNSSHVEFRLFRGTLKYSSLMLCLEFVNALCRWCMEPCEVSEYQSAGKLLEFARAEPETYPHLISFLAANI